MTPSRSRFSKHLQTRAAILNRAREQADFRIFQHPLRREGRVTGRFVTTCDRAVLAQHQESC